ncbi:hypothetical protein F3N42_03000 [Marinihelvus fidelis]|uniref:UrcA family protein n=1 Tax=Marinihelvus fidelis TaxID=2613842 RepID=A0A5N0THK1_9GAMM|nr:hypothetical protein [Marinihelvus fidelis]KAA9133336.1 hypothetical protein F3N42_03000 [Marinihelvus fidelis]
MKLKGALLTIALGATITSAATAQDDGSEVILPLEAQTCSLPAAPARIPDEATYDDLKKAKGNIGTFQAELTSYRECLDSSAESGDLTDGNEIALGQAHNYSVEMEERVAEQFNEAVRSYKERKAAEG